MERDEGTPIPAKFANDFNSHAHVERDIDAEARQADKAISTHTLTWSVTVAQQSSLCKQKFQLTRSRGA